MPGFNRAKSALRRLLAFRAIARSGGASFSHYGEDIIFARLLRPGSSGTYVDVGAHHPVRGSNSFLLYTRGWSGLAIDPNPEYGTAFRRHRPRDTYVAEGVARTGGTLTYRAFQDDVFNTFDAQVAEKLLLEGRKLVGEKAVRCRPLADIVDEYLPGRQIDLLNVDCEGLDMEVLDSLDLTRRRPTTIIVEDYPRFFTFQRNLPPEALETFLRNHRYAPLAQAAWSGLYVAEDWRDLFLKSAAFDAGRVPHGYLPAS